jgi:protein phosphatase PTC2/3
MIAGIWDCLTSQDVVNFVRYQVSKGKELTEIGEMMCDYCLAPDTNSEMIGCDNMTVLIVAITHGRSKKEWYTWITKRVKNKYGYETPSALPELYSKSRLDAFGRHKERHDKEQKEKQKQKLAAERNASTSSQSAASPSQARSQNGSSTGSDESPKSNAIGWVSSVWQRGWSIPFRLIAMISGWLGRKNN